MRPMVVRVVLAVALVLIPAAVGQVPARSQDFSITNPDPPPATGRRSLVGQLQAWWDVHAYYPRRASRLGEGGTVRVRLVILPDGNILRAELVSSSGSEALDTAAVATFRGGFVRPFPPGEPEVSTDVSLHYVLARRDSPPAMSGSGLASSRRPFTITDAPTASPILETMLQRTCTGTVVKQGIRNNPAYGVRQWAQAIFFRRPDGSPWVRFYEGGFATLAPVVEVGKVVKWSGRKEYLRGGVSSYTAYTVWADDRSNLNGSIEIFFSAEARATQDINRGGTIDLSCADEVVPSVGWNTSAVTPVESPAGDPP